jgi:hypothetical protein
MPLFSGESARLSGVPFAGGAHRAPTEGSRFIFVLRLRTVLRLFDENQLMGAARSFRKTPHGINSLRNSPPPGSKYDQSPAYVSYFHFAHIHMFIVLRTKRRVAPGFSG